MNSETFYILKRESECTKTNIKELEEYAVENAVILAAGISKDTMYAPPKGLLKVEGVPIIERQICQLKEVGINEIYIVVGYKKEMYFYLEDKYGVKLIGNPRIDKNNIYSLYLARDYLKNTYVCSCDYYYEDNPFSKYEYLPYHSTAFLLDAREKFVVNYNSKGRITSMTAGGEMGECIHGFAYFDREFSETIVALMEQEINKYRVSSLFWQEFCARHFDELDLYIKHFEVGEIREFDDLSELKTLNVLFVNSVSTMIVKNICDQLKCQKHEIESVDILEAGHSNITFKVLVRNEAYVYRYPGVSGKNIVDRERECFSNKLAKQLQIDNTLIYIDKNGHKLSNFVDMAHPLNRDNNKEMELLAKSVYRLHKYELSPQEKVDYLFSPLEEADRLLNLACSNKDNLFEIFKELREDVHTIAGILEMDNFPKAICHCNLNSNNCLITDDGFELIDWEFSGYCDIAYDFPFLGDYEFRTQDLEQYLNFYYQRKPTESEYRHWLCYRAVHYWYYTCWAMYKESVNEDCGNLLLVFYENCKKTAKMALQLLGE